LESDVLEAPPDSAEKELLKSRHVRIGIYPRQHSPSNWIVVHIVSVLNMGNHSTRFKNPIEFPYSLIEVAIVD
jgi:hypothetical protein